MKPPFSRAVRLVIAVGGDVHQVDEGAVRGGLQQRIPARAPDQLDDVPARTAELALQLLDDLAVAAHRAVEPLQVAVDDEREVVQVLLRRDVQRATGLDLVHLAVAQERPGVLLAGVLQITVLQVLVERGLLDGGDRADAHRHGRELPEVLHGPRVRVGRHAVLAGELLAEAVEVLLAEAAHEIGAGVDAGGGVALEEDVVAAAGVVATAEEVVEADLVHGGDRGVAREVAADGDTRALGTMDHHRRVPAVDVAQLLLELHVAGILGLLVHRDGVHVVRGQGVRQVQVLVAGMLDQALDDLGGAVGATMLDEAVEGLNPFLRLLRVRILRMAGQVDADGTRSLVRSHTVLLSTGGDGPAVGAAERRWARLLWPRFRSAYRR